MRHNFRNAESKPRAYGWEIELQKLQSGSSQNYARRLEDYYDRKYGQAVTPITILKTLAVRAAGFRHNVKLWVLNVAPSRHLKTQTSQEQELIFSKGKIKHTNWAILLVGVETICILYFYIEV